MNVPIFFISLISLYYLWGYLRVRVHFCLPFPLTEKEIVMRLLIRLVSLAVAAYSCYSGAITGEWKASIAIVSLCALVFLITFISKARGGTPGSQSDGASAIYTPSSSSNSSCSSDGGGGDC